MFVLHYYFNFTFLYIYGFAMKFEPLIVTNIHIAFLYLTCFNIPLLFFGHGQTDWYTGRQVERRVER